MVVNKARFKIDASPSEDPVTGDRGVDVVPGQTIAITLEQNPARVLSVSFSLPDDDDEESPYRSINEKIQLFDENSLSVITSTDVNATFHITIDPTTEMSSYVVRCQTVDDQGTHIYERMISVRGADLRMTVPAERQEYGNRGWSDAMNEMALAIAGLIAGGAGLLVSGTPVLNNVVKWNGTNAVWGAPSALPNMTTDRLLGRDTAGTGQPEEIALDTTLEFTGGLVLRRAALTGDVTAAAGSNVTSIAAQAVVFTKIQNISAHVLLGRDDAASGVVEEIALNSTLEWTGSNSIQRAALTGAVTAAAGSNVTALATGIVTLANMANMNTSRILGRQTAGVGVPEELTVIGGLEFTTGAIQRSALVGDITAAAGSNTTAIAAGVIVDADVNASAAIAFTKLALIATDRLLGRDTAGTGTLEALIVTGGLEFTGTGGIQRSALTGDITATAGSGTTAIAAGVIVDADVNAAAAISLSKLANIVTDRLVGRDTAGTGALELLTVSGGLEFNGVGIQRSALTGDVTAAAGSNVTVISAGAVTLASHANIATDRLLGRDTTGSGPPEELIVTGGLEFTGVGGIQRSALSGDITAAAGSNTTAIAAGAIVDGDVNASAAIALTKLASVSTATLLGRNTAGTGPLESLTLNTTLEFSSLTLRRAALTGDITAAAGSNTTAITAGAIVDSDVNAAAAIALTKLASINSSTLLGRTTAGIGAIEVLTLNSSLEFSGTTLQRAALTGDVTAAAGSNATTIAAGAIGNSKISASANIDVTKLLASGTNGRALSTLGGVVGWNQLDLSSGNTFTGQLALSKIAPSGTDGRVMATIGGVATWGTALGNSTDNFSLNGGSTVTQMIAGVSSLTLSSTFLEMGPAVNRLRFDSTIIAPVVHIEASAVNGATGTSLEFAGQDMSGTGSTVGGVTFLRGGSGDTGGIVDLRSGVGATATKAGSWIARIGNTPWLFMPGTAAVAVSGNVRLPNAGAINSIKSNGSADIALISTNSGDGVFLGDTVNSPSISLSCSGARLILGTNIEIQNASQFRFDFAVATPSIIHETDTTGGVAADTFQISAQSASGALSTGGDLRLASGTGTSANGVLRLYNGTTEVLGLFPTSAQVDVSNLVFSSIVATPGIGQNADTTATITGDSFSIYAQDCSGTTAVTAGAMTLRAGDATGGSGTRTGGALLLRSGTGANADGRLTLQVGTTTVLQSDDSGSGTTTRLLSNTIQLFGTSSSSLSGDKVLLFGANQTQPGSLPAADSQFLWSDSTGIRSLNEFNGSWTDFPVTHMSRVIRSSFIETNTTAIATVLAIDTIGFGDECSGICELYTTCATLTGQEAQRHTFAWMRQGSTLVVGALTSNNGAGAAVKGTMSASTSTDNLLIRVTPVDAANYRWDVLAVMTYCNLTNASV